MKESILHSAELTLYLPITFGDSTINQFTPWIKAGISDFSICHIFDNDLDNECPSSSIGNDNQYTAIGTFEIVALQKLGKYQSKLYDIFDSEEFLHTFTQQMNLNIGSSISTRRRLALYGGFTAISVNIIDTSGNATTPTPLKMTDTHSPTLIPVAVSGEASKALVEADSSLLTIIIAALIVIMVIMCIGFGCLYRYKTKKSKQIIEVTKQQIEGARIELNQVKGNVDKLEKDESKDNESRSAEGLYDKNVTQADEYKQEEDENDSLDKTEAIMNPFEEYDIGTNKDDQDVVEEINRYSE